MRNRNRKKKEQGKSQAFFGVFLFLFILFPTILSVYLYQKLCDLRIEVASDHQELLKLKSSKEPVPEETDAGQTQERQVSAKIESWVLQADMAAGEDVAGQQNVYLTFDDGPSVYTNEILDILKKYQVKATFFVLGREDKESLKAYRRIVKEGHTLGMHSYSHDYEKIYDSLDAFSRDFMKLRLLLYETTGVMPMIYRFPGGSSNHVSRLPMETFIQFLNEQGITYCDWNAANGDALGTLLTARELTENVMESISGKSNAIVLMHDAPAYHSTVEALPDIIEELKAKKAGLLPFTEKDVPVQHIVSTAGIAYQVPDPAP